MGSSAHFPGELQQGDLIGGTCTVLDYIGRGAMGHVYRVRHNTLNAEYALKMLSQDQASEEASRLFQREAGAIKILSHPNVVRIYDVGLHGGKLPYYAMELLVGRDLAKVIRDKGPLSPTQAAEIFMQVCAGLGYVHARGIAHRDIKPSNIFILDKIGAGGEKVKVVDFGIVSFTKAISGDNKPEGIHGTPFYMSPEQCTGQPVDSRSDIYSLGCTMFEALTGKVPFQGKSPQDTMEMQVRTPVPTLKEKADGVEFPEAWETIIAKTMAKDPADRYQTMDQVSKKLAEVISNDKWSVAMTSPSVVSGPTTQTSGQASGKKKPSKMALIAASAVAGIAILGGVVVLCGPHGKSDQKGAETKHATAEDSELHPPPGTVSSGTSGESVTAEAPASKPFVSDVIDGGKMIRLYDLPTDISLGYFRTKQSNVPVPATGQLKYPLNTHITFTPSAAVGKNPDCLKRFKAGDIYALKFDPAACDDEIFKATANISGVRKIIMPDCKNLTNASCETFKKFTSLVWLEAPGTKLDAAQLAKADIWSHMEVLALSSTHNVLPLLEQLKNSKQLQRLDLSDSQLTSQEISTIATMTRLTDLDLSHNKLTKQDLASLSTLVHLTALHLADTGLSGSELGVLKNLKYLTYLDFSDNSMTDADLKDLVDMVEAEELDFRNTQLDGGIVDALRGYGSLKKLHINSKKLKASDFKKIRDGLPLVQVD